MVDVDAFYGETPEVWDSPDALSDVIGTYTGFGDRDLKLCDEPVSDISTSLVDLGTLFGNPAHPLTLVGLVAFRGLAFFESDPADVGSISFFNGTCAVIDHAGSVFGLDVAEDYPFDLDGDGHFSSDEYRDYVIVAHRQKGVLIYDVTNRDHVTLAGRIPIPGQAERVSVDADRRRLYVSGAGGGIYVVDFDAPPAIQPVDANQDLVDDRVIEIVSLPGNTNSQVFLFPELGLAYAGGLDRGLTSLAVGEPKLAVVVDGSSAAGDSAALGRYRPVSTLAPLGVPAPADQRASFRVLAALPGVAGDTVHLDLAGIGPGGLPVDGAGELEDLPVPSFDGDDGLVLHRLAENPWEDGSQLFLSDEVVAVADLRAARAYQRSAAENAVCARCNATALGIGATARELLSGERVAVRFPEALRAQLAGIYDTARLDAAEIAVPSVRWEMAPALRQEPTLNPALAQGDAAPGTLLHSGEMSLDATDLSVRGRGLDFAFHRAYRSQTVGTGPLGPGWDHLYHQRLRELPTGDVEYYDGRGRRETFTLRADGGYDAPPGRFVDLSHNAGGWMMLTRHGGRLVFDVHGRLATLSDPVKDTADTGNELRFVYDTASRLVEVIDALDRSYVLRYDAAGRLESLTDFTGRKVQYAYDPDGRLESVRSPSVTVGEAVFPNGLETRFDYQTLAGTLDRQLNDRDNIEAVTDAKQQTWLELAYGDPDGDGRANEVTDQTWGGHALSLTYDFDGHQATVTDRRSNLHAYTFDAAGHVTAMTDPDGNTTTLEYDAEGLTIRRAEPMGRVTEMAYDTNGDRRSRGNLMSETVTPDGRGANGSMATQVTTFDYDGRTNQPQRITDPWGGVTEVDYTRGGLPEVVRRAVGTAMQTVTRVAYNEFGQPTRVTDPDGRKTDLSYFDSGADAGYLRSTMVDPGGLALTSRYEVDARGNVTATVDPRGVRSTRTVNELDWPVETMAAASPSADGAPALNLKTTWVYDANGNLAEERLPVGTGGSQAATVFSHGMLDELLSVSHTVPSSGQQVSRSFGYDEDYNVVQRTDPVGTVTEIDYDARDLPVAVRRGVGMPEMASESFAYDADGTRTSWRDGRGELWASTFDGYGRPAASVDPLGNRTETLYPDASSDPGVSYQAVEVLRESPSGDLMARSRSAFDPLGRTAASTPVPVGGERRRVGSRTDHQLRLRRRRPPHRGDRPAGALDLVELRHGRPADRRHRRGRQPGELDSRPRRQPGAHRAVRDDAERRRGDDPQHRRLRRSRPRDRGARRPRQRVQDLLRRP